MAPPLNPALHRPIALAGFMAAGKSTVGRLLAHRLGRRFADADSEVERRAGCSVRALFERDGEAAFRELERGVTRELLLRDDAPVIALGGGALTSGETRALVRERAFCAWLDVPFSTAWERIEGAPGARPLAGDRASFETLGASRGRDYVTTADAIVAGEETAENVAGALAQQVWTRPGIADLAMGGERSRSSTARCRSRTRAPRSSWTEGRRPSRPPRWSACGASSPSASWSAAT